MLVRNVPKALKTFFKLCQFYLKSQKSKCYALNNKKSIRALTEDRLKINLISSIRYIPRLNNLQFKSYI